MIHSDEICTDLCNYAACTCNSIPTFWNKLSVPSSSCDLKPGKTDCPKVLVRNYQYNMCNNTEECIKN